MILASLGLPVDEHTIMCVYVLIFIATLGKSKDRR
jgi:hypothetical protein